MRTLSLALMFAAPCLVFMNCSHQRPFERARALSTRGEHQKALKLYERLCREGDAAGCARAGSAYEKGLGVHPDPFRAFALTRRACGQKAMGACVRLARMSERGIGTERNLPQAFLLYQRACLAKNFEGCIGLGSLYERGVGTAKDTKRAAIYYRRACAGKNSSGCLSFATLTCFTAPHKALCAESYSHVEGYCEKGSVKACHLKALVLFSGMYALPQKTSPLRTIAKLSRHGCDQGYAPSCFLAAEVGLKLLSPRMGEKEIAALITKACRLGHQRACVVRAHSLYDIGGPSRQKALGLYETACKENTPEACNALGLHFTIAVKKSSDAAQGAAYFGRACFMGESSAALEGCLNLGRLFHRGIGVTVNRKKAALLYKRVCAAGIKSGCTQLKILIEEQAEKNK